MNNNFPNFSTIQSEKILTTIEKILADNRAAIAARLVKGAPYTWDNFIVPMEELGETLHHAWSPINHLHSVMDTPALREAYNQCLPKLAEYSTELGQNVQLYQAYNSLKKSAEFAQLDTAQQKVITNALRDFKLSGVALTGAARERYQAIQQELSQLHSKFEEHVLDATNAWQYQVTDENLLRGLPEHALASAKAKAQEKKLDGWLLALDQPSYIAVMQYADDRAVRERLYHAYQTRASELSDAGKFDNSPLMEKILALRQEEARLLDYAHFADYALVTKMANDPKQVLDFLRELARAAKPFAQQEFAELKKFAAQHGVTDLQSWDVAYFSEKLRKEKFNIDDEALRVYFPEPVVLAGMFEILKRLYGMQVKEIKDFDRWHKDVKLFEIRDEQNNIRGHFYTDLYARSGKRSGAWMDEYRGRYKTKSGLQTPVAYLTCNFSPPIGNDPALLTHHDVQTLFHEFGHCLHHLLTKIDYPAVGGISGVSWDAVELPSQFFENWCWSEETLPLISRHYQTGESLPSTMLQQLLAAKNFQAGLQMLRQIEFSLFDMRIHLEFTPQQKHQIQTILQEVRDEVSVFKPPVFTRFPNSFTHIFAGGYAAGYYGYKWAEVLSADAFDRFANEGIFNRNTGAEFLHAILEMGGSRDAMDLFVQFRGREPQIEALLRQEGMVS